MVLLFPSRNALDLFKEYDPSEVKFIPAVPPPSSVPNKKLSKADSCIKNVYFKDYLKQTLSKFASGLVMIKKEG